MKRIVAPILGSLFLAGCFDAEVSLNFQDKDTVQISTMTNFDRDLYDMLPPGEDPCAGSEHRLTETTLSCYATETMPITDLINGHSADGASGIDATEGAQFEHLDEVTYRVTIDFQSMFDAAAEENGQDLSQTQGGMLEAVFAGRQFTIKISGEEIVESTGEINKDQTQATMRIPMTALVQSGYDFGEPFVTTVRTEKSCRLFVFC